MEPGESDDPEMRLMVQVTVQTSGASAEQIVPGHFGGFQTAGCSSVQVGRGL